MIRIMDDYKLVPNRNPVSRHEWNDVVLTKRLKVSGGFFQTTFHQTQKSAEEEKSLRESMVAKFPFTPPRSEWELEKAKKLGLL